MLVLSGAGSVHFLVPGCDYIIGRKTDSDILVADINCGVSRHHGLLSYHINGELLYTDKSQYGSFIDLKKIEGGQSVALKAGSEMKLGHHPTIWKLEQMKVAVSNLQGSVKREVVSAIKRLDIAFSGGWDDTCTILIMNKISSTVKVIKAVSHCRLILNPAFVKDLDIAIKNKTKISVQDRYAPPVDPTLRTAKFSPIAGRKTLFEHLQFVFMSPDDKKESEELVKDLGGTVAMLDPLCPDRRKIILSEESIVMETKDAAVSGYIKTTLLERGLVPTKSNDLILALLYNDKSRLFKKSSDTQSTQSAQLKVQDTQAFSQMTCTIQETQSLVDNSCDESKIEASALPPRLDKTIPSFLKPAQRNSPKVESCASTIKPEMYSETTEVSRIDEKKPSIPLKAKQNDISFYEASVVPPKLDKTIKTPLSTSPLISKQEISFIEPSAVPPRLDMTTKSPLNTMVNTAKSSNTSALNSSIVNKSSSDRNPTPLKTPAPVTPLTSNLNSERLDLATPTRTSIGSSVSLFDNSRSTSFFGASTPSATVTSKTPLVNSSRRKRNLSNSSDSDEDEEDNNVFKVSKTGSNLFSNTTSSTFGKAPDSDPMSSTNIAKKPKTDHTDKSEENAPCQNSESERQSVSSKETTDPDSSGMVCESPPPPIPQPQLSPGLHQTSTSQSDGQQEIPSASQSFKRELQEKTESATKKLKTGDSPVLAITTSLANVTIPDTSRNVWLKRPDTKSDSSLETTEITISADLIQVTCTSDTSNHVNGDSKSVVNFKRFKKAGVIVRSMDVTLSEGQFRSDSTSIFDASQSQQSVDDEDDEPSLFSDRFRGGRRTLRF